MTRKRSEKSTPGRRLRRYAKVSATTAGLAARVAGEKFLGLKIDRPEHARKLMEQLGALKGPLVKVAQLLATIPNALPAEYTAELQKLQSQAPPMGWPFVRRRMQAELGEGWEKKFKAFDKDAAAAASLGQVHKAVTLKGEHVACKLQYPDMSSAVEADLKQLGVFLSLFEKVDSTLSTSEIRKEIADRLREELDYGLEAKHQKLYAFMLQDEEKVHVPKVIDTLSTERLLTSTWAEGEPVMKLKDAREGRRAQVALNIFRAWYVPLYYYGVIHGDPHMGNYTVTADDAINLLDFGCVRVFPPAFVGGVITLYHALREKRVDMAVEAYESWGFRNLNKKTIEALNMWARFLYGPVLEDKTRPIGTVPEQGIYGRETARKVHQELKKAGGVTIPREFVFMDRAALGLGSVFLHLRAEVNWHRIFNELIADFDVKDLAARQREALRRFEVSRPKEG